MQPATDNPPTDYRWLRRFCYLVIAATFALIAIGGKVTSFEYGMAIPGGFTTGGWISFLAPLEYWYNDTDKFWEHTHRIKGTIVGFLTIAMTIALWRTQRHRPWLKWMGVIMLILVCIQGAMGAFRVSEVSLTLAFIHGIVGQVILCSWIVVAAALSRPWLTRLKATAQRQREHATIALRWSVRILLVLLLVQLTLGSAVRHFKADKAIPDFPLIYSKFVPPMSQQALDEAYIAYYADQLSGPDAATAQAQALITNRNPKGEAVVSLGGLYLQLAHRVGALIVCGVALGVILSAVNVAGDRRIVAGPAFTVMMLLTVQFALGVLTVMTETEPLIATLHQATGAALIAAATWLAVRIHLAEYAAEPVRSDLTTKQGPPAPNPAIAATPAPH